MQMISVCSRVSDCLRARENRKEKRKTRRLADRIIQLVPGWVQWHTYHLSFDQFFYSTDKLRSAGDISRALPWSHQHRRLHDSRRAGGQEERETLAGGNNTGRTGEGALGTASLSSFALGRREAKAVPISHPNMPNISPPSQKENKIFDFALRKRGLLLWPLKLFHGMYRTINSFSPNAQWCNG